MRGAGIIWTNLSQWGRGLTALLALLAVSLHVLAIEGHVHVASYPGQGGASAISASAHPAHAASSLTGEQSLSNPSHPSHCIFCQAMTAAGAGLIPAAPLLVWFGAAALVAALFGQRQVSLQRLNAWRSRAPPLSA
jgi:hypothetical protein